MRTGELGARACVPRKETTVRYVSNGSKGNLEEVYILKTDARTHSNGYLFDSSCSERKYERTSSQTGQRMSGMNSAGIGMRQTQLKVLVSGMERKLGENIEWQSWVVCLASSSLLISLTISVIPCFLY